MNWKKITGFSNILMLFFHMIEEKNEKKMSKQNKFDFHQRN